MEWGGGAAALHVLLQPPGVNVVHICGERGRLVVVVVLMCVCVCVCVGGGTCGGMCRDADATGKRLRGAPGSIQHAASHHTARLKHLQLRAGSRLASF